MASRLTLPGSLSLVVAVLVICAFAAHVDAHKCSPGWATCTYGRTCKTNLWSDLNNCGQCGSKCAYGPHAISKCTKGKCSFECDNRNGWCDCDGNHHNGCEANIHNDKKNCGKCGHVCPAPLNFIASCVNGACLKECKYGYQQCNTTCAKLTSDVNNCGSCGHVCPTAANATASCVGGTCALACNSGLSNCTGVCVDLSTDILNCGTCANVCPSDSFNVEIDIICDGGQCGHLGCFPGDATVTLASGGLKRMIDLALGDKVAVRGRDGSLAYEDVYAFGHRDASASSSFVQLTVKPIDADISDPTVKSRTLELTAFHFVPVSSGMAGKLRYKRAQDVTVGDKMWAEGSAEVVVTSIAQVQKQGLYNPFTLGGTIIVNGVVASSHSEWFLDDLFQFVGLVQWLPSAYQAVLLPVRMLYSGLGKDAYLALYRWVDALVDVAAFGSKHGGSIFTASAVLAFFIMAKTSRRA